MPFLTGKVENERVELPNGARKIVRAASIMAATIVCLVWSQAASPSSEKWEKEIAAFEAADRTNEPPAKAILFVGSSSIRLWTNLAEMFPGWTTIRRGFGGSHLRDVNAYFDRVVLRYQPAAVVVFAGENDIAGGRSPEQLLEEFKVFMGKMREKLPRTKVYYLSAKLSPSRWHLSPQIKEANAKIRRHARFRPQAEFVDVAETLLDGQGRPDPALFAKDRLHLNEAGYERWARKIRQAVEE